MGYLQLQPIKIKMATEQWNQTWYYHNYTFFGEDLPYLLIAHLDGAQEYTECFSVGG